METVGNSMPFEESHEESGAVLLVIELNIDITIKATNMGQFTPDMDVVKRLKKRVEGHNRRSEIPLPNRSGKYNPNLCLNIMSQNSLFG